MDEIAAYHARLAAPDAAICEALRQAIDTGLPGAEGRYWHAHPVWFLNDNPIVGYSKLKGCIRLMFWSGQSFPTPGLTQTGSFKAAEVRLKDAAQVATLPLPRWLEEAARIQWDYANIVKRKGRLEPLKGLDDLADH